MAFTLSVRSLRPTSWFAAAALSALALGAQAAQPPTPVALAAAQVSGNVVGEFSVVPFTTFDQTGFSFSLSEGYAYNLVLDLNGAFSSQTGLIGYAQSIKFDGSEATWALLSTSGSSPETYRLGLYGVDGGKHWIELPSINAGTNGRTALDFSTLSTPAPAPVPEPETYAMMLAGLGVLTWAARRRNA